MQFEYDQYVRACLVVPLSISLFMLSMLFLSGAYLITAILRRKVSSRHLVDFLLAVLVCGFFLFMNVGRLLHGGIHLIYERESDAVELQGKIVEIKELGRYSFPEIKTEYGYGETNGVRFIIDGVECTAVTKGNLAVGDDVTVIYLPRSGYILSITLNDKG